MCFCQDKNELLRAIKRIDKWSKENGINVNRKKSGIFIIRGEEQNDNVEGYPILNEYNNPQSPFVIFLILFILLI